MSGCFEVFNCSHFTESLEARQRWRMLQRRRWRMRRRRRRKSTRSWRTVPLSSKWKLITGDRSIICCMKFVILIQYLQRYLWRETAKSSGASRAGEAHWGVGHVNGSRETNKVLKDFDYNLGSMTLPSIPQFLSFFLQFCSLRSGADTHSTARVLVTIVQLSFEAGDWPGLNERIIDLVKKRSQLKQAVAKMVTEACTFLDKTPDKVDIIHLYYPLDIQYIN